MSVLMKPIVMQSETFSTTDGQPHQTVKRVKKSSINQPTGQQ